MSKYHKFWSKCLKVLVEILKGCLNNITSSGISIKGFWKNLNGFGQNIKGSGEKSKGFGINI